jgi:hypothetical protein
VRARPHRVDLVGCHPRFGGQIQAFLAAGHTRRHVLDIVLGVGMKTLSNYTKHIAHTPAGPGLAGPGMDPRAGGDLTSSSLATHQPARRLRLRLDHEH